jgi:hypothetical protein
VKVGAKTVNGAHHSPKTLAKESALDLENVLRGSGDVGAMLSTAWAVKQVNRENNRIYVKNVKPRDFEPCDPFEIEGRPHIDQAGDFKMVTLPGQANSPAPKKAPKAENPKVAAAKVLRTAGKTHAEIAAALKVTTRTVENWESKGYFITDADVPF